MTREELIKKVALKMDEISSSDDVIVPVGTGDNNPLYTQINSLLNESVNDALMKAPVYRIENQVDSITAFNPVGIFGNKRKAAVFTLSEMFLRLVSITDNAFQRPIVELAIEGDDVAKKQYNKFLVAKSAKPVAVIGHGNGTERIITCYSYGENDTPKPTLRYVKRYNNSTDTSADTDLDEYMIDLVSWVCAGKVFAAHGDMAKGKICDENAAALMI